MQNTRSVLATIAAALAFSALPLAAQQPTDQARPDTALRPPDQISRPADPIVKPADPITHEQNDPELMTAQGQLVKVDATAKVITIKTLAEPELKFSYSDATKVVGAGENVAGLATLSGTDITVKYIKRGMENVATEISVQKPKA